MKVKVVTRIIASFLFFGFERAAVAQYADNPGRAYGENICILLAESDFPAKVAVQLAMTPLMGFQGASKRRVTQNAWTILNFSQQVRNTVNEDARQKEMATKMLIPGLKYALKNCRSNFSQSEYKGIGDAVKQYLRNPN